MATPSGAVVLRMVSKLSPWGSGGPFGDEAARSGVKLRWYLILLALVTVLPVLVFAVALIVLNASSERDLGEHTVRDTTRALSLAVDRELGKSEALLTALATSPLIDAGDFGALHRQVGRLDQAAGWISIIKPDGEQFLNTLLPYGAPLPRAANAGRLSQIVAVKRMNVSNLYTGALAKRPIVSIGVPVIRDGVGLYSMDITFGPERFTELLREQRLPQGWLGSIFDANGMTIARTQNPEKYVGYPPPPDFVEKFKRDPEGFTAGVTREGVPVYWAWARSPLSGWTVSVAVPEAQVKAPLQRLIWNAAVGGAALLALALLLAMILGRQIAAPIGSLANSAKLRGGEERLSKEPKSRIAEVRELQNALVAASAAARERLAEREQLAREQSAREEAQLANKAKDEFLAMLGHELRNPLAAITTAITVLDKLWKEKDATSGPRGVLRRQAAQLTRIVDDLLDVSRVTSGKIHLNRSVIDLGQLVERAVDTFRSSRNGERANFELSVTPVGVYADSARMEQVLTNLVDNAFKFSPSGGVIRVSVRREGADAVLEVTDTGEGIDPQMLARVFDLFSQGEQTLARSRGGLGLGLALTRQLVEMHGGKVHARSDGIGRGATFTVHLPAIEPMSNSLREAVAEQVVRTRPLRVVIIEDNADALQMLRLLLAVEGHEVHEADAGKPGIEQVLSVRPDAAIVDIGLPDMNGYEVARHIRKSESGRDIKLVALTGYGQDEDRQRAMEAGFDWHLVKPATVETLRKVLDEAIDRGRCGALAGALPMKRAAQSG